VPEGYRVGGGMGTNSIGNGGLFAQLQQSGGSNSNTDTGSLLPSIQQGNSGYSNSHNQSNVQAGMGSLNGINNISAGPNPILPYGGRPMLGSMGAGMGMGFGDAMGLGVGLGAHGPPGSRSYSNANKAPTHNNIPASQNNANPSDNIQNFTQNTGIGGGGGGGAKGNNRNPNHSNANRNHNQGQSKLHIAPLSKFR